MGFEVFIKSLLCHNPGFDYDFIICDVNMNEAQRSRALDLYPKIKFIKPDFSKYKKFDHSQTPKQYYNCNYIYELFKLKYDTVVAFDMDMLVCDSIEPLFQIKEPFSMCRCYRARTDSLIGQYNSGLLVVKIPFLSDTVYFDLLKLASKPNRGGDQEIFNEYFKGSINEIPKKYNIEKRYFYTKQNKKRFKKDVSIIHFVGVKPWQIRLKNEDRFHEWEAVWWGWYSREKICVRHAKYAKIGLVRMLSWIWNARGGTDLKDLDMIEIGSYAGDSSEIFAQNVRNIICVDPYENGYDDNDESSRKIPMKVVFEVFSMKQNLFKMIYYKSESLSYSKTIKDNAIELVYIDGLHTYKGCKEDIQAWLPKIMKGGFIAGHDYGSRHFPGVRQAVDELLGKPDAVFEDTSWVKKV